MNRGGGRRKGRPKLFFTRGGKKKRKITEYIDFFYSLHHLYKYIEPPLPKNRKETQKNSEKYQRNTETHNSSKANRKRERTEGDEERKDLRKIWRPRRDRKAERVPNCAYEEFINIMFWVTAEGGRIKDGGQAEGGL